MASRQDSSIDPPQRSLELWNCARQNLERVTKDRTCNHQAGVDRGRVIPTNYHAEYAITWTYANIDCGKVLDLHTIQCVGAMIRDVG
jgi:hypothetical protein